MPASSPRLLRLGAAAVSLLVLSSLSPFLAEARAASFDCSKTELGADETTICQTPALDDMDVRMVTTFELVRDLLPMGGRSAIEERQIAWLAERKACEADQACIAGAYDKRLSELRLTIVEIQKQQELQ